MIARNGVGSDGAVLRRIALLATVGVLSAAACMPTAENVDFQSGDLAAFEMAPEVSLASQTRSFAEPRLIRTGSVRIEVDDLDAAVAAAQELARQATGFVAGSDLNEGAEGARTASLTLRVPSDSFQSLVGQLAEVGRVLSVSMDATDVSREYFDLETRLAVKTATVERLQELITRSGDLEDLLAVERELGRATGELESMKGQIAYFDQQLALSTLRVTLYEPGATITAGAFRPVVVAFRNSVSVFAESVGMIVYLLVFLVPWMVLAGVLWPLIRRLATRLRPTRAE